MHASAPADESLPKSCPDARTGWQVASGGWSGVSNHRITWMQLVALLFPLAAGVAIFGWRAAAGAATLVITAVLAALVWQRVGRRGSRISVLGMAVAALMLAMTLPAHLFSSSSPTADLQSPWPILPAAGIVLAILCWLLGGTARVHPVLLTHLLLVVMFQPYLVPRQVLQPDRLVRGDLLRVPVDSQINPQIPWLSQESVEGYDAYLREPIARRLTLFTTGIDRPERGWLSLESLIRDRLPPIEDLMVAGEPRPIGTASTVFVIVGGLFLLYRGLIDYRIPLVMISAAFLAFLVLPVPILLNEQGPQWRWLAWRDSAATWGVAVTFANYELLASPLIFAAMFLATSPSIRPLCRRWRVIWAGTAGVVCAALQLYVSVEFGPYVALILAGLLTPLMDRIGLARSTPSGVGNL
ncbi:MAG TPA: RnfABCDGE type electron transport complex subunit D [Tepidisphaeraceae bacterium]|nr:RnfABCDGE type electron transport complex subunit D [Tepidisphaeraceae bacterium]